MDSKSYASSLADVRVDGALVLIQARRAVRSHHQPARAHAREAAGSVDALSAGARVQAELAVQLVGGVRGGDD